MTTPAVRKGVRAWIALLALVGSNAQAATRCEQVTVGLDDLARTGCYAGVRVVVRHEGPEPLRARLVAECRGEDGRVLGSVARAIELPTGSRKEIVLPLIVVAETRTVDVSVFAGRRRVAFRRAHPLTIDSEVTTLYVIGDGLAPRDPNGEHLTLAQAGSGGYGRGQRNKPVAVRVRTLRDWSVLPIRRQLLQSVDTLLIASVPPASLTTDQQRALKDWITDGGSLIVGTSDPAGLRRSFLAELLPVELTDRVSQGSLRDLALLTASTDSVPASFPVFDARLKPKAQCIVGSSKRPVVARLAHGPGSVTWLGFDPTGEPFASWPGRLEFWQTLVRWHQGNGIETCASIDPDDLNALVREAGVVSTPSRVQFLAPLIGYAFTLVVVSMLVARVARRREWTWLALVVVSAGFTVLYCVPLRRMIKGQRFVAGVTLRYLMPTETLEYHTVETTLFAPVREPVALQASTNDLYLATDDFHDASRRHIVLEDRMMRIEEDATPWSLVTFSGRHSGSRSGRIEATFRRVDDDWHYRLVNRFPFALRHGRLRLLHPELLIERALPPLLPNVPVNVTLTPTGARRNRGRYEEGRNQQLGRLSPRLQPAQRERKIRDWLVAQTLGGVDLDPYASEGFGAALVAFADRPPFDLATPGFRGEWRHLVVTALPGLHPKMREQLQPSEDASSEWHEAILLSATARVETDNEINATLIHPGEAVFEYALELHPSRQARKLFVITEGKPVRGARATLAAFNWRTATWTTQTLRMRGNAPHEFTIDHVHPGSGRVWLKLVIRGQQRAHLQLQNVKVSVSPNYPGSRFIH